MEVDVGALSLKDKGKSGALEPVQMFYLGQSHPESSAAEESTVCQAHSNTALKYQLGKETKRGGFGLKSTHLFSRSIYLFIN